MTDDAKNGDDYAPPENPFLEAHREARAKEREVERLISHRMMIEKEKDKRRRADSRAKSTFVRRPERDAASRAVSSALRSGQLTRRPCEVCGERKTQAHHDSYERAYWLKVRWFCRSCHEAWHRTHKL